MSEHERTAREIVEAYYHPDLNTEGWKSRLTDAIRAALRTAHNNALERLWYVNATDADCPECKAKAGFVCKHQRGRPTENTRSCDGRWGAAIRALKREE